MQVAACLQHFLDREDNDAHTIGVESRRIAFESALYECLTARSHLERTTTSVTNRSVGSSANASSPSRIGVKLNKRDREDQGIAFEGIVYRFYAD